MTSLTLRSPQSVEQPVQIVVGVVQVEADAHRSGADRCADARALKSVGGVRDRYRYDGRILLGQTEFRARPIRQADGVRLDRGAIQR